jgi:hypothetical protein
VRGIFWRFLLFSTLLVVLAESSVPRSSDETTYEMERVEVREVEVGVGEVKFLKRAVLRVLCAGSMPFGLPNSAVLLERSKHPDRLVI